MARAHSKKADIEKLQRLVIAIDGVVNYLPLIGYTMEKKNYKCEQRN